MYTTVIDKINVINRNNEFTWILYIVAAVQLQFYYWECIMYRHSVLEAIRSDYYGNNCLK